jgi:hypothetical protein
MDTPVFRGYESFYGYLGGSIDYYRKRASNAVNSNSTIIQPFGGGLDFWINTTAGWSEVGRYSLDQYIHGCRYRAAYELRRRAPVGG